MVSQAIKARRDSPPDRLDGERSQLRSKGDGIRSRREENSEGETIAQALSQISKPPEVFCSRRTGCLDLNADDSPIGMLENYVDLYSVSIPEVLH